MTIQAVFFDMGGTIETFCYTRALRLEATPGIQKMLLSAGIDLHLNNEQLFEVVSNGLERYHHWRLQGLEELPTWRVWSEYILGGYDYDPKQLASSAEALTLYVETHYYQRTMRTEVPAVLKAIQDMGLKIGMISNVISLGQVPTNLEKYGIRHYFNPLVLSSEYGRRKPDPAIFHYAARLANVPTSHCVYVGDRISRDIIGAQQAGFRRAVQIRHDFEHGEIDTGARPDAVIHHMTELIDILNRDLENSKKDRSTGNPAFQPVRAILFDAGDILYFRPEKYGNINKYINDLGLGDHQTDQTAINQLVQRAYCGRISQDQYREELLNLYGVTQPEQIEQGKAIIEQEENRIQIFAGVKDTLLNLKKQGYLLGIVTDTAQSVSTKLCWFGQAGFGEVWDTIIASNELGIQKPHPDIYRAALRQLGVTAAQTIFVGHKATEIDGARAVGIKTVGFNYEESVKADSYIENFCDLLTLPLISNNSISR